MLLPNGENEIIIVSGVNFTKTHMLASVTVHVYSKFYMLQLYLVQVWYRGGVRAYVCDVPEVADLGNGFRGNGAATPHHGYLVLARRELVEEGLQRARPVTL